LIEEQGFMPLVENVFEKGEIARFTIDYDLPRVEHVKVKGATHRILDVIISPIKDMHGKVTNAIVQHNDITERKQAEEELRKHREHLEELVDQRTAELQQEITEHKQAKEEIRAQKRFTDNVIDSLPDTFYIFDPESGKGIQWNRTLNEISGYDYEEMSELPPLHFYPPEEHQLVEETVKTTLEKGRATVELNYIIADGTRIPFEYSTVLIEDAEGKPCICAIGRDITERKQAEEELRKHRLHLEQLVAERTAELQHSNTELEQFAYVASHDLQEPLRMVASFTQLLARRYKGRLDADADDFIGYAVDGANRMQRLINDLLEYSRLGTRGKPFEPTHCEAVLNEVRANLQAAIEESGAVITHDPLPTVMADRSQLTQLFQNLIDNAIKFRGDEPVRIHVGVEPKDGEWVFSVRDNGVGIDPQYHERIFVIFETLHSKGEYPGSGMGLAICRKIVERHGGRIWVESELGKGSTFYFAMPLRGDEKV